MGNAPDYKLFIYSRGESVESPSRVRRESVKIGFPYTIAPVVQVDLSFARIVALLKSRKPKPNRITITKVTRAFEKRGSDATPCLVAELAI